MIALMCTFGFDTQKVIRTSKAIKHDRLVVVTGVDNLQLDSFQRLSHLYERLGKPIDVLTVKKFDLVSSQLAMEEKIESLQEDGFETKIGLSGGLHILCDAALVAAFNTGAQAFYVDEVVLQLPILRKARLEERLGREQRTIILSMKEKSHLEEICVRSQMERERTKKVLRELKTLGFVTVEVENGVMALSLSSEGERARRWLSRLEGEVTGSSE